MAIITYNKIYALYIVIGCILVGLTIYFIIKTVTKKEKFLDMEKKQERNESNERYELMSESQNASSPYPPEPMIPFQIYQPLDNVIDIIKIDSEYVKEKPNIIETQGQPEKQSTFCTCGGLIHQTCLSTVKRVDNYNRGLTEFAKLPNKDWQDVMPYDQWTDQPNYDKQNTKWFDTMPYDIYRSNKK